ncbi:MAG: Copper metallochaperone [Devosia sp.]|uniref:copper chaperone PCu(A)C n=1 Tax=Devosia sp. TaxID=1871048 RepID=UPI0026116DB8|nr:copper chaperone PCu(A)C [Devosia sp.]MDB5586679.1 Copper metallochaperone [Devosia sp.]
MLRTFFRAAVAAIVMLSSTAAFAQEGHDMGAPVVVGTLELSGGFARATLPNAPVGGAFVTITNNGTTDDRLVSVSSSAADVGQIHDMSMQGDVMKMRQLPDGVVIPAGETITFQPAGLHMMFMGLKQPFVEGQTVKITLTFEQAGSVDLDVPVLGAAADSAMHMDH